MRRVAFVVGIGLVLTTTAQPDSLFRPGPTGAGTLIAKQNRFQVGDIITVIVQEEIESSTRVVTNTKKESDVVSEAKADDNEFLIGDEPGGMNIMPKERLPNWGIEAKNEHKARGEARRTSTLETTVSCIVVEIGRHGLLQIEGDKVVAMNREDSRVHVSGIIRARDVTPANTIRSNQIANASITLKGKGPLWNSTRRGLVTRFLDWFSPF